MRISFVINGFLVGATLLLVGCSDTSVDYYAANQKDAMKVIHECQKLGIQRLKVEKCVNAIKGNAIAYNAKSRISDAEINSFQNMGKSDAAKSK